MDNFPDDQSRLVRRLQRDVSDAQGSAGRRPPLTKASAGWQIPNTGTPDPPADGGHLFVASDDPFWIDKDGIISPLKSPDFPQASPVASPPNMTAGATAPGSYSTVYVEALREDIRALRETVFLLMTALRTSSPPLLDT